MIRFAPALAALAAAVLALAPAVAEARDHHGGGGYDRGYYDRGYDRGRWDDRGRYDRRHGDNDDAVAAGVVGLVLGAVIGAAVADNNARTRAYPPPQRYYQPPPAYYPPPQQGYYPPPPPRYYGDSYAPRVCVVRERQWDPYAGQYVRVERRVPC